LNIKTKKIFAIVILAVLSISIYYSSPFFISKSYLSINNHPPIAKIITNSNTAMINEDVTFNGSKSYDIDGNITEWIWEIDNQIISNKEEFNQYFTETGIHNIILKVKDEKSEFGTDSIQITILENQKPEAKPKADKISGRAPLKVEFIGNAVWKNNFIPLEFWR